jgi:hypothetical protein
MPNPTRTELSVRAGPEKAPNLVRTCETDRQPPMERYFTDGTHLYEIADMCTVQNYGLARGTIRYIILRDCVSEATAKVDELQLAALSPVR